MPDMSDESDIVSKISEIEKPLDVSDYWAKNVRPNKAQWSHPLSELERAYIAAFRDESTPKEIRMRAPVDPGHLTPEEAAQAADLFGKGENSVSKYANYENRRRILAHYVYTHPATVQLELGLYRFFRDINPIH